MKSRRLRRFLRDFESLPPEIKKKAKEKYKLFKVDPWHSSFERKRMGGHGKIWEAHITEKYVFTFVTETINGEEWYIFRRVGDHTVYNKP